MAQMFGELVNVMTRENVDILGDLFQSSISYHEAGQYLSPQPIADLLAKMSIEPDARPTHDKPVYVNDPACGTGRMLLATAEVNPHVELVGQDVDVMRQDHSDFHRASWALRLGRMWKLFNG